jgi:uncharacterized membrane protein
MTSADLLPLAFQVTAGVCLAACCGLRAFLPLFVLGSATRLGLGEMLIGAPLPLNEAYTWLGSTPALVVFGAAVVVEVLADKVPAVDHLLDLVQTGVRPLAGAVALAASTDALDPLYASVLGLVLGGTVAGGVHVGKAKIRLLSTLGTGGIASPVLSFVEDALALVGSVLALLATVVAVVLILAGIAATALLVRHFRRRAGRLEHAQAR